jgi:hypothetical protein
MLELGHRWNWGIDGIAHGWVASGSQTYKMDCGASPIADSTHLAVTPDLCLDAGQTYNYQVHSETSF